MTPEEQHIRDREDEEVFRGLKSPAQVKREREKRAARRRGTAALPPTAPVQTPKEQSMVSRLVLFIPDPFVPGRIPIARLTQRPDSVHVEALPLPPLGATQAALVELILGDIRSEPSMDVLSVGCGPQVVLGPPVQQTPKETSR